MDKSITKNQSVSRITLSQIAFFLFFAFYLILPEYFAIEVSSNLPLLTGSRFVLLLLLLCYLYSCHGKISFDLCKDHRISKWMYVYFAGMFVINIINIRYSPSASIKAIFTLVFEEWIVVWLITRVVTTRARFMKAIRILVYASGVVAIVSAVSTLIGNNLFYYLNTVQRTMLQASYIRMGFLRAEAGFGHPVYYGMYCVLMMILAFYLYEKDKSHKAAYFLCILLNLLAVVLANSRGSLVTCAVVLLLFFFTSHLGTMRRYIAWILLACAALIVICIASGTVRTYVGSLISSLIGIFDKTVSVSDYGDNAAGMSSRWGQWTSIAYVLQNSPIFGLGAKCHENGLLKWFWNGEWENLTTLDMGIVAIIVQYGLAGFMLYINLFVQWLRVPLRRRKSDATYRFFLLIVVAYLIGLLTISSLHDTMWVLMALILSYINIDKEEHICMSNIDT